MKINGMISAAVATAALVTAAAAQAGVPIVQDGDFSAPSGGASYVTYAGGSSMGLWNVTGDSVDLVGGYWQAPTAGGGSVDLDGNAPGGISQDLGVLKAGSYDLTFYLSANPDGSATQKLLDVSVGGVSDVFKPTTSGVSHANMNYALETVDFTSNGSAPTILSFASGDSATPYGPVIGGVSVAAVPEPGTWAMLILGVGLIGIAARRRREGMAVAA